MNIVEAQCTSHLLPLMQPAEVGIKNMEKYLDPRTNPHIHTHTYTHTHMYACTCTNTHTHTYTHTHMYACAHTHTEFVVVCEQDN